MRKIQLQEMGFAFWQLAAKDAVQIPLHLDSEWNLDPQFCFRSSVHWSWCLHDTSLFSVRYVYWHVLTRNNHYIMFWPPNLSVIPNYTLPFLFYPFWGTLKNLTCILYTIWSNIHNIDIQRYTYLMLIIWPSTPRGNEACPDRWSSSLLAPCHRGRQRQRGVLLWEQPRCAANKSLMMSSMLIWNTFFWHISDVFFGVQIQEKWWCLYYETSLGHDVKTQYLTQSIWYCT